MSMQQIEQSPVVVVVDIETLGIGVDAVIATIGAVCVNVLTGEELGSFYDRCHTAQERRTITPRTLEWWFSQGEEAQREAFGDGQRDRYPLKQALERFAAWMDIQRGHCPAGTWLQVMGNGPEFDNVILDHAYEQHCMGAPWQYPVNQSLRTMVWLGRLLLGIDPRKTIPFTGTRHIALHDARHESQALVAIVQAMRERMSQPLATA